MTAATPTPPEDWRQVLKTACQERSQAAVARQLGVSPSTLSQVLNGTYRGNVNRIQTLIEGRLMNQLVACPIAGDIGKHKCQEHQARPVSMATVNPLYSRLYRACRSGCPFSQLSKDY